MHADVSARREGISKHQNCAINEGKNNNQSQQQKISVGFRRQPVFLSHRVTSLLNKW